MKGNLLHWIVVGDMLTTDESISINNTLSYQWTHQMRQVFIVSRPKQCRCQDRSNMVAFVTVFIKEARYNYLLHKNREVT